MDVVCAANGDGNGRRHESRSTLDVDLLGGRVVCVCDGLCSVGRCGIEHAHCLLQTLVACWLAARWQSHVEWQEVDVRICRGGGIGDGVGEAVGLGLLILEARGGVEREV